MCLGNISVVYSASMAVSNSNICIVLYTAIMKKNNFLCIIHPLQLCTHQVIFFNNSLSLLTGSTTTTAIFSVLYYYCTTYCCTDSEFSIFLGSARSYLWIFRGSSKGTKVKRWGLWSIAILSQVGVKETLSRCLKYAHHVWKCRRRNLLIPSGYASVCVCVGNTLSCLILYGLTKHLVVLVTLSI